MILSGNCSCPPYSRYYSKGESDKDHHKKNDKTDNTDTVEEPDQNYDQKGIVEDQVINKYNDHNDLNEIIDEYKIASIKKLFKVDDKCEEISDNETQSYINKHLANVNSINNKNEEPDYQVVNYRQEESTNIPNQVTNNVCKSAEVKFEPDYIKKDMVLIVERTYSFLSVREKFQKMRYRDTVYNECKVEIVKRSYDYNTLVIYWEFI